MGVDVLRYAAFTDDPASGNPAGVVPDAAQLTEPDMLGIAAGVGYSETAFITKSDPQRGRRGLQRLPARPGTRWPGRRSCAPRALSKRQQAGLRKPRSGHAGHRRIDTATSGLGPLLPS